MTDSRLSYIFLGHSSFCLSLLCGVGVMNGMECLDDCFVPSTLDGRIHNLHHTGGGCVDEFWVISKASFYPTIKKVKSEK